MICMSACPNIADDCKIKKLAVKKGEVLLTLNGISEKECKLACGDPECYAITYDKKDEVCTAYASVEKDTKDGKSSFTPWKCPIGKERSQILLLTCTMSRF